LAKIRRAALNLPEVCGGGDWTFVRLFRRISYDLSLSGRRPNPVTDGAKHTFEVLVGLKDIDPNAVRIELLTVGGSAPVRQKMARIRQ
jgi:hypothetical protein